MDQQTDWENIFFWSIFRTTKSAVTSVRIQPGSFSHPNSCCSCFDISLWWYTEWGVLSVAACSWLFLQDALQTFLFWVMTVGLSLHYSDSIWQAILSHLKRLLPLKSQVLLCVAHPLIRRLLKIWDSPRVPFYLWGRKQCSVSATIPSFKVFVFHLPEGPAGILLSELLPYSQWAAFHVRQDPRQESQLAFSFT